MNSIFKRASVRNYTGEKVSEQDIELLLKAGMAAPSAMNIQPWELVAVQDREELNKIMEIHPYSQMLKTAGLAIIVCADTAKEDDGNNFWMQDCSAVTENIMLEATELGLGSVWLGTYPKADVCKKISKLLELPKNIVPFSIISVGHPSGEIRPKDKFDKSKIHYEKW